MQRYSILGLVLVSVALLSCGGGQKTGAKSGDKPGEPGDTAAVVGPPQVAWDDMNHEQRELYMKKVVLPTMKEMLVAYDPERFDDVTCMTCHGDGATDGTFKMPNPDLPRLPATEAGWGELAEKHPKMLEFMATKVKPKMAELIGEPEFDPEQPEKGGFGCMECHAQKE